MSVERTKLSLGPTSDQSRARRRLTCAALLLGGIGTLVGCKAESARVKTQPWEAREEAESLGASTQAITITRTIFEDQFDTFSATTNSPVGSGKKWYIQQNFKPNGEIELYGNKVCPDSYDPPGANTNLGTADNAVGVTTDANNWAFCMVNDVDGGASNALWLRAHNDGAGNINSGRINSKRLMEFAPTASEGIRATVRLRNYSNSWDANPTHGSGWWPAVWFLQKDIAESPIINDTDNVSWPCERAHEIDLYEHGSLTGTWGQAWGPNYNKSSMHYRNDFCIPQSVQNTLGSEVYNDTIANNAYHTFVMELETTKARFYYDGTQYGPEQNVQGLKFDTPFFWLINAAVGGNLGGGVDWSKFTGDYKSMFIDYVKVEGFNWSAAYTNLVDTTDANAANLLYAATDNSGQSGMQAECCSNDTNCNGGTAPNCTSGGKQDMGWIDASPDGTGDWVQWNINVPTDTDWKLDQRNAVNNGGGTAGYRLRVDGVQVASGTLPNTGGWQTWATNSTNSFRMTAGNHILQWQATTSNQNLQWVRLYKAVAATCSDYVKNQGETNIDCGGPCGACPSCSNGVKDSFDQLNWFETGVDCGGPCAACSGNGSGSTVGSKLQAENAAGFSGTQIETTPGNGTDTNSVGFFDAGDWIKFTGVNMTTLTGIRIRAAGANSGGVLEVRSASTTGLVLGTYTMVSTGGWTTWADRDVVFNATDSWTAGDLYLIGKTGSGIMNFDTVTLLTKDNSGGQGTAYPVAIPNPGFASGTTGWSTFFQNGGSFTTVAGGSDNWGRITIPAIASPATRWHQQLYQTQVSDGGTYTLKAYFHGTSSAKTIDCFMEKNGGDYANYALSTVTSTGSSNWVQCNVTSSAIPAGQSFKFGVRGGDTTATYDLDDFQLIDNP